MKTALWLLIVLPFRLLGFVYELACQSFVVGRNCVQEMMDEEMASEADYQRNRGRR